MYVSVRYGGVSMPLVRLAPIAAIVALSIALVRVVAAADSSPSPDAAASAPAATASAAATKTVDVNTYHFAYDPDPITIAVGTKVTFKNSDDVAHTVTSSDDTPSFDSGEMAKNVTWSHIFAKAGTYKYFCQYHTYMKGTVIVK